MRTFLVIILALILPITRGIMGVYADYKYDYSIGSYWELSDKASTIPQKSEYINKFVSALESEHLEGTNANYFLPIPASSFNENMKALKSLQSRLNDIQKMDEKSFEYQTAIQQITAQEQGEAGSLLDNIKSCWFYKHYYSYWDTLIVLIFVTLEAAVLIGGVVLIFYINYNY